MSHEILTKRRAELEQSLEDLKESAQPVDLNNPIGRLSRQDALQQQQMSLHARKQVELSLKQVEEAFKRLETGEYGICSNCEEEISPQRLKAKPEAHLCIECSR